MQISSQTMTNMALSAMNNGYNNYSNILNSIISGKNFTKVSQNHADASKVMKLDNEIGQLNLYQDNIKTATNEMNLTYEVLEDISSELGSIQSLTIQAATATTPPDSAKAIAAEIKERVATIQDKLNTKYLDNYIFSGTFTTTKPYDYEETLGEIAYQGSPESAGDRNLTISANTKFTYNVVGEKIVNNDFFSQMKELDELLNAESLDYDLIREKLDIIDTTSKNVTREQGNVSALVSKLTATSEINSDTLTNLVENKADLEEVDIVKAATALANAQSAMQASYLLGTQVMNSVSLLDYL